MGWQPTHATFVSKARVNVGNLNIELRAAVRKMYAIDKDRYPSKYKGFVSEVEEIKKALKEAEEHLVQLEAEPQPPKEEPPKKPDGRIKPKDKTHWDKPCSLCGAEIGYPCVVIRANVTLTTLNKGLVLDESHIGKPTKYTHRTRYDDRSQS